MKDMIYKHVVSDYTTKNHALGKICSHNKMKVRFLV